MYFFDDNLLLNHNNTTKTMSFPNKSSWLTDLGEEGGIYKEG